MKRLGSITAGFVLAVASTLASAQERGDWSRGIDYGDGKEDGTPRDQGDRGYGGQQQNNTQQDRGDRRGDRGDWQGSRGDRGDRGNWQSDRSDRGGYTRHDRGDRWDGHRGDDRNHIRRHDQWRGYDRDWDRGRYGYRDHGYRDHGYYGRGDYGYRHGGYRNYGRWRAPSRYRYPRGYYSYVWSVGHRLPHTYYEPHYYVDYRPYGLAPPPYGYRWVRVDDDVLLVALATGLIAEILSGFYYY